MKRLAVLLSLALVASACGVAGTSAAADASVISCVRADGPIPLVSAIPGATIVSYRIAREIDTDFYGNCSGSEDSTYVLTLVVRNATRATLAKVHVECKVYGSDGLLEGRLSFPLVFPAKLDPGDSGRADATAAFTHASGQRISCRLDSAT